MSVPVNETFRFCPRCSQPTETIGDNPFRCAGCGFTLYFSPVTAVGGLVTNPLGELLMIRRAADPGRGKLGLPGGFIDPGESAEQALIREVFEEVRLDVLQYRYLVSYPNSYSYRGIHVAVTDLFFVCEVRSLDTIATLDGEVAEWFFVEPTPDRLDEMAFESNRRAIETFLAARQAPN